eukprot:11224725-Alexandrium_andersonii.AAC.1
MRSARFARCASDEGVWYFPPCVQHMVNHTAARCVCRRGMRLFAKQRVAPPVARGGQHLSLIHI